jgi:hypothetical protein
MCFHNTVLKEILEHKEQRVIEGWRKLHNVKYKIKSRRIK